MPAASDPLAAPAPSAETRGATGEAATHRRSGLALAAGLAAVLAATALAYLPALDGELVLDDLGLLQDRRVTRLLDAGLEAWLTGTRPVATALFALNHAAVGRDPRGWHLTSVAVHLCVTVLAFLVARRVLARAGLARPAGPALAAAALFALHPLQTEAVAYVAQRSEALAAGLVLATWLALLAADGARGRRRLALLAAATLLHALALGSKPTAATAPVAWLLLAALLPAPGEEGIPAWRRAARRLPAALPLLALSAAAAASGVTGTHGSMHAGFDLPWVPAASYLATQLHVVPRYLALLAWPAGLCADREVPPSGGLLDPAALAGLLALALLALGAILAARRARAARGDGAAALRLAALGAGLFLLALAPSSLVPLIDPMAEHRVYLAALGPLVAVAAAATVALRRLAPARAGAAGLALAAAAAAALGIATARRAEAWSTALALWSDTAAKAPGKARVQVNLGWALAQAERHEEALRAYDRAYALRADHTLAPETLFLDRVGSLVALGRLDDARAQVRRALAIAPADPLALALAAEIEHAAGRDPDARRLALAALDSSPGSGLALRALGRILLREGDVAGALGPLRAAGAAQFTDDPVLYAALGEAEERGGDPALACAAYRTAAGQVGDRAASARASAALARLRCR